MLENLLIAVKPNFPHYHIFDYNHAIQNFFMSKSPRAKNHIPFEEEDLEFSIESYTHLPNQVLDCRAFLEKVFYSFLSALTTQALLLWNFILIIPCFYYFTCIKSCLLISYSCNHIAFH